MLYDDDIKDFIKDLQEDGAYGEQCKPGILIEKVMDNIFSKSKPKLELMKSEDK